MKSTIYAALLCGAAFAVSSCNKHIYVPNQVNVPLLKEKYEFKGSVTPSNLQAAFAITDHIAVMANGQYLWGFSYADPGNNFRDDDGILHDNNTRGGLVEGAVGFFQPIGSAKKAVFDVYAGYGSGHFKTLTGEYKSDNAVLNDYVIQNRFSKVFVQPSFGFVHRVVEAAFSSRFSFINFYDSNIGMKAFENQATEQSKYMKIYDKSVVFYEPAFTVRVGYKYVKFQAQLQFSTALNRNSFYNNNTYDYNNSFNEYFQPVNFNMGVAVDLAKWYNHVRR
ncbi:hypothetical protein [Chitinophaga arvensicola]|uniref:Uncharacterized protein n=1 Tax=Chitinophaga arvensicola TaxID=29529 RepID=A0A1I0SDU3_9BACT|nr:hypothetical protein [Chitinophaga arvensicola]SEW56520.1 hypothetical protein SAMN04488122_6687 [Chitinophaga arvensicola]